MTARFSILLAAVSFVSVLSPAAAANKYACSAKQVYQTEDNGTLAPSNNYFLTLWGNVVIDAPNGQITLSGQAPQKWKILQQQTSYNEFIAANPNTLTGPSLTPNEAVYVRDFPGKATIFRVYAMPFIITGVCQQV
jgi:hypothetical protein